MSDARRAGNNSHVQPPTTSKCKPAAPRSHHSVVVESVHSLLLMISWPSANSSVRLVIGYRPPALRPLLVSQSRAESQNRGDRADFRVVSKSTRGAISIFPSLISPSSSSLGGRP